MNHFYLDLDLDLILELELELELDLVNPFYFLFPPFLHFIEEHLYINLYIFNFRRISLMIQKGNRLLPLFFDSSFFQSKIL